MPKVLRRAIPAGPLTSRSKDRAQVMKEYAERQTERGNKQVKVWIPGDMVPWLHRLADDARTLAEMGFNPLTASAHLPAASPLPEVLLMRKNWALEEEAE